MRILGIWRDAGLLELNGGSRFLAVSLSKPPPETAAERRRVR
jgi:hypothetical protein